MDVFFWMIKEWKTACRPQSPLGVIFPGGRRSPTIFLVRQAFQPQGLLSLYCTLCLPEEGTGHFVLIQRQEQGWSLPLHPLHPTTRAAGRTTLKGALPKIRPCGSHESSFACGHSIITLYGHLVGQGLKQTNKKKSTATGIHQSNSPSVLCFLLFSFSLQHGKNKELFVELLRGWCR